MRILILIAFLIYLLPSQVLIAEDKLPLLRMRVGAVLSLTGDAAVDGKNIQKGLELAAKDLLKEGLEVKYDIQDDQTVPKQALSSMRLILSGDKPDAVVGPIWSFLIDSAGPVILKEGVCTFVPSATSEITSVRGPNLFYGAVRNSEKVEPVTKWLKKHSIKRAAMLVSDDLWGASHEEAYKKAARKAEVEIVFSERIQFGLEESSLSSLIVKMAVNRPEVLLWTGYEQGAASMVSAWRKLKLEIPILGTEALSRILENQVVSLLPQDQIWILSLPSSDEFNNSFRKSFGDQPGSYAENAYDGMILLGRSFLQKNRRKDKRTLSEIFRGQKFDANGDLSGGSWKLSRLPNGGKP